MERFTISKSEKQTIYEIYRACRICGAGGGYRMPIIQNIIDLESSEVELRQKIQDCLQLEIRPDDRMPPLICELCVDKVNDFYQFLELTRQTNVKTRTRLGLPIQDTNKGDPEPSNCILGVTEPVYTKDDERPKEKAGPKSSKIKKEPDAVSIKAENTSDSSRSSSVSSRAGRASRRAPSPPPSAPSTPSAAPTPAPRPRRSLLEEMLNKRARTDTKKETAKKETRNKEAKDAQKEKEKKAPPAKKKGELESLLEDNLKYSQDDDNALLVPRATKRAREEPPRPALLPKRAKPVPTKELLKEPSPPRRPGPKSRQSVKEPSPPRRPGPKSRQPVREPSPPQTRPGPKSKKARVDEENIPVLLKVPKPKGKPETPKTKEPPKQPEETATPFKCAVCDIQCKNSGAFARHMSVHVPTYTKPNHACNPCGKWFVSVEQAAAHHRYHGADTFPYHCRRCFDDFQTLPLYDEHISKGLCVEDEPPSVKCDDCSAMFATEALRAAHKCAGSRTQSARPGVNCSKCSKTYATAKNLKKHESQCGQKRKGGGLIADPDVLRRLKPMQVRITKCDGLLARGAGEHYDVSTVKPNYGLAKKYIYPYMKLPPVKNEPLYRNSMVAIPAETKEEFSFTHWDSDDSDIETTVTIPTLSTLAIKKLFSKNLLGKVPRKRKKVKHEAFDNDNEFEVSTDINDIISSLDDMGNSSLDRKDVTAKLKDIIGCLEDEMSESVTNEDNTTENLSEVRESVDASVNDKTTTDESSCKADINENDETATESEDVKDTASSEDCSKIDLELNKIDESTNDNVVESNDNSNCNNSSNVQVNLDVGTKDTILESNELTFPNELINRLDSEIENHPNSINNEIDISLQKISEGVSEIAVDTRELDNVPINGISIHENENSLEDDSKSNQNECSLESKSTDVNEVQKTEVNKESPIKHSIENLIGETEKNPDKYISEVISSIENIIMNNPRNEEMHRDHDHEQTNGQNDNEINDSNVMDAFNEQLSEKRISDQDKITLEDLLPKEVRHCEELENISDDDFNFDA